MLTRGWTSNEVKKNLLFFAYSVACAKKQGATIELHTDNAGKNLLGFLPYDAIHTTLEGLDAHPKFWCAGKFEAYRQMELGDVHIDGDVFIKKQGAMAKIANFGGYDAIFQMQEKQLIDVYRHNAYISGNYGYPVEETLHSLVPYNCGVVGFNNQKIKDEYCAMANRLYRLIDFDKINNGDSGRFCVIIEQWRLTQLLQENSATVQTVFSNDWDNYCEGQLLGYEHVCGDGKYRQPYVSKIERELFDLAPELLPQVLSITDSTIQDALCVKNETETSSEETTENETETSSEETTENETETPNEETTENETETPNEGTPENDFDNE
jgi:hypothetical protein